MRFLSKYERVSLAIDKTLKRVHSQQSARASEQAKRTKQIGHKKDYKGGK